MVLEDTVDKQGDVVMEKEKELSDMEVVIDLT